MTVLDRLAIEWATAPDFTDDPSNDYRDRYVLASDARERNRNRAPFVAQCGHNGCGRKFRRMHAAVSHVDTCKHRPAAQYRYGR